MKAVFESLLIRIPQDTSNPCQVKDAFRICELKNKSKRKEPRPLKNFEILYIKRGRGILTVDTEEYILKDDTIYCLARGQYRAIQLGEQAEGYCISVSQEFLTLADCIANFGRSELVMMANAELYDLVSLMYLESLKQDKMSNEIQRNLLKVFIMICLRETNQDNDPLNSYRMNDDRIVKRFFSLLQQNIAAKKHVGEYADALCITPNYLNAVVKRQTGFPASHHIQQLIISEAKRHAIYSDLRLKEIADRLGFDDCAHFSRFFKHFSGVNFSTFKRQFS